MKIVEEFIKGKNQDPQLCEDGIFKSKDLIAVIDGATAKTPILYDGMLPGKAATEKVKEALQQLNPSLDVYEAVDRITQHLAEWYRKRGCYQHLKEVPAERPSASVVIYNRVRKEIWQVGDCAAMIDNVCFYNRKLIDDITTQARCLFLQMQLELGKTAEELSACDSGREFIMPLLKNQSLLQNNLGGSEYAWEVLDGFPVLKKRIKIIDASGAKSVVLASDGYPKLFQTLEESEAYLQNALADDPLCMNINKGTKGLTKGNSSFDDRAYIRIEP